MRKIAPAAINTNNVIHQLIKVKVVIGFGLPVSSSSSISSCGLVSNKCLPLHHGKPIAREIEVVS